MGSRRPNTGQLYVVRGHLDSVQHDAALLGLDEDCWVDPRDRFLLPDGKAERPRSWPEGWGRVPEHPVWLVQSHDGTPDEVLLRLKRVVSAVAVARLPSSAGRTLPLLAVPVLPVPRPRPDATRRPALPLAAHTWLSLQLEALRDQAAEHGVDIVLLAQDAGEYAAAQWIRRTWPCDLGPELDQHAQVLGGRAALGQAALFLGTAAGISAGLPDHTSTLRALLAAIPSLSGVDSGAVSPAEQASLVRLHDPDGSTRRWVETVRDAGRPGLLHALVAGTGITQVVTACPDTMLEQALEEVHDHPPAVLPWRADVTATATVVKSRGDVEHPGDLSLTPPNVHAPAASVLRGLATTHHLVVLGSHLDETELTDALRRPGDPVPGQRCGTLLDLAPTGREHVSALWGDRLARIRVSDDGSGGPHRTLLRFLDRVGVHASGPQHWLLDERFAGLLPPRDQVVATQVRAVLDLLPGDSTLWAPLLHQAERLGWMPPRP
ncbi:hypothetical protein [Nocardioides yefusunii]|uniref:Uncharacterized protein n=1 Tax=Nocardioides yefusunii TaxID=2500546 RepID=A0ABW1QRR9_9ACTN|nr:hypothetical protein [Nocardioides yefusunii]